MPCEPVGVGRTCRSILAASVASGYACDLHTLGFIGDLPEGVTVHASRYATPPLVPYRLWRRLVEPGFHHRYLAGLEEGDLAYFWPSVPVSVYEAAARRGILILSEMVNSRMASARLILDAAYDSLGLPPGHGITDERIRIQDLRHHLCAALFAPSPMVEASTAGTGLEPRLVPVSYGTHVPAQLPERRPAEGPVTFIFVGYACVRKGAHLMLDAWRAAPKGARLRIVGEIEPAIALRFADVLNRSDVSCAGFQKDVAAELLAADVAIMPSLEEGDPIATYEAAAHGLPIIASAAGAGRIGAETGAIDIIDPMNVEAFRATLARFAADAELRRDRGAATRRASFAYDWSIAGPRRFERFFAREAAA